MKKIMVTGVGAIIGYGILRSLNHLRPSVELVGTDIYPDAVGQIWCDRFEMAPLTSDPSYLDWLSSIVTKHSINFLIPGIEQDLYFLSDQRDILNSWGITVLLNTKDLVDLSRDKWLMYQKLVGYEQEISIPSYLSGNFESLSSCLGLPFILKPRRGYASKGLVRINHKEDFQKNASLLGEHFLAQPVVGKDEEEYTVGIFGDGKGNSCASIVFRRRLATDGSTAKAWVENQIHEDLNQVISRLCSYFKPLGPTNLQFRKNQKEWKLLEINPRISSSTSIRCAFGYNESLMALHFFMNNITISQPKIRKGFAVRFIEDHIIYDRHSF
ncbi:MAG: ATP-grasp domain-containing protein [Holosporales bacterium]|nr:ATP-grasp domain-containing protein [Holosporales bacterium]